MCEKTGRAEILEQRAGPGRWGSANGPGRAGPQNPGPFSSLVRIANGPAVVGHNEGTPLGPTDTRLTLQSLY